MEMINIINQNKARKQEEVKKMKRQQDMKKERINYVKTIIGYIIATYVFIQIVTLLVK